MFAAGTITSAVLKEMETIVATFAA